MVYSVSTRLSDSKFCTTEVRLGVRATKTPDISTPVVDCAALYPEMHISLDNRNSEIGIIEFCALQLFYVNRKHAVSVR